MPGGRPSKYKSEYCEMVDEYLADHKDQFNEKSGRLEKVKLPTITGYSLFTGVPESTLYDWRDSHPEFSESLSKIVKEQKSRLLNMGLSGEYNSTIAKLILSSNHGMSDKVQQDVTSKGESITGINIIAPNGD